MKLYKLVEIDVDSERARIKGCSYSDGIRNRLLDLCDLFEAGKFQACLDEIKTWTELQRDSIGYEIGKVLIDMGYSYYYTRDQIIADVKKMLEKPDEKKS